MNTDFDVSAYLADRKRPIKDVMDIMKVGSHSRSRVFWQCSTVAWIANRKREVA